MVFRLVLFCVLFIFSIVSVQASSIEQMTLKNGMHVVVKRDTRSPVVLVSLWYHVGSANEHDGVTGISHLLEHMMFRGTRNVSDGDFPKQIIACGGRVNAFTFRDNTAYVDEVAVSQIPLAKQALIGHFPLALASNAGLSYALMRMAFYHLPMTYLVTYEKNIQAVTLAQAKAVLAVLHPHRLLTVQVGG